jgi:hypothetical protein
VVSEISFCEAAPGSNPKHPMRRFFFAKPNATKKSLEMNL